MVHIEHILLFYKKLLLLLLKKVERKRERNNLDADNFKAAQQPHDNNY